MHNIADLAFVLRRCHRGAGGEIEASGTPALQAGLDAKMKMIYKHEQEPRTEKMKKACNGKNLGGFRKY